MSIEFLAPEVDELTPRSAVNGGCGVGGNALANQTRSPLYPPFAALALTCCYFQLSSFL